MPPEKSQFPKLVMVNKDFKDSRYYTAGCECGSNDCNISVSIEYNSEMDHIYLSFDKEVGVYQNYYYGWDWDDIKGRCRNIWERIIKAGQLLFTGHVNMTSDFILESDEHIDNFMKMLNEAIKFGRDVREDSKSKKEENANKST